MLTTVITNFGRPRFLKRAIASAARANAPKIVVSSCGATDEVAEVHRWAREHVPGIVILSRPDDPGCNRCWLDGVLAAETPWVHILHDDDMVGKDCYSALSVLSDPDIGFVLMDGFYFDANSPEEFPPPCNNQCALPGIRPGKTPAESVAHGVTAVGSMAFWSPLNGFHRKKTVAAALEEAEWRLAGPEFHVRPKMIVGNDLLIWIRAVENSRWFHYDGRPLVGYGMHGESTTHSHVLSGKYDLIPKIYDRVKMSVSKDDGRP